MCQKGHSIQPRTGEGDVTFAYDLVITGGQFFNSSEGILQKRDVAIHGGRVEAIATDLLVDGAREVYDARGAIVTPGLVDVHAHVFDCVGDSVDPDQDCLLRGTTTVVDGGSAGANTFEAFVRLMQDKKIGVLAWLNLSTIGQVDTRVGELLAMPHADVSRAVAMIEKYPTLIVGLKARLSTYVVGGTALPVLRLLRECADATNRPIMIHIGDTGEPLGRILPLLRAGDVVTHMMTGRKNGIVDARGRVRPEVVDARERGVLFDASRGLNHEAFPVLEACLAQGFLPDTISTDLTKDSARNPAYGLPLMASHFMSFGMNLPDVLARITTGGGRLLNRPDLGRLVVGGRADCTILRVSDEEARFVDVDGRVRDARANLVVDAVVRNGSLIRLHPAA